MNEFWRDSVMDNIIKEIVDLFTLTEGVELVRLNGLTKHLNKDNSKTISKEEIKTIISKLNKANVIDYKYEYHCPHCGEISYIIIPQKDNILKLCDTCNIVYMLENNKTLFPNAK